MKIAIVTEILNTHSGSRASIDFAQSLVKFKNEIIITALATNCDYRLKKELEDSGIAIILLPKLKFLAAIKFLLALKKVKPEIISFHGTLPFFMASKLSGLPIVKTYYGTQLDAYFEKIFPRKPQVFDKILNFLTNQLVILIEKIQFILADKIVAVSKFASWQAEKMYKTKIDYCYLGASNLGKINLNPNNSADFILSVSRFTPYKGFHDLIAACGDLPLKIVGSGGSLKYLKYLNHLKGENCQILTGVSDSELANLYKDCLFYASFDRFPFFGLPIVEAASFAKPTISLNFGAVSELIQDQKTGFIVKNLKEFSQKAHLFFKNPELSKKMGLAAKIRVKRMFNWSLNSHYYNNIFRKILMQKSNEKSNFGHLLILLVIGTILRVLFLNHHDFWFDEAFSFFVAKQNLSDLISATAADNNPPLYYILLHFWLKIAGVTPITQRTLSTIFGILTIPAMYFLAKELFNEKAGKISALFAAFSPLLIYFSAETRMYSQLTLFGILTTLFFLKWLSDKSKASALWFIVSLTVAFYTNYYSLLLLIPLNLLVITKAGRKLAINFFYLQTVSFILFLPWLLIYFLNPHPAVFAQETHIALPATLASFVLGGTGIVTLREFFEPDVSLSIITIFGLSLIVFGIIFLRAVSQLIKNFNLFRVAVFLISPLLVLLLTNFFIPVFSVRGTVIFAPFFYLITAAGITSFPRQFFRFIVFLTFLLLTVINFIQLREVQFKGPPFSKILLEKNLNLNSTIVHSSVLTYYPFAYYQREHDLNFLIGESPLTYKTQSLIGTKVKKIAELPEQITLVEIKNGDDPTKLDELKNRLLNEFKIKKIENFAEITFTNLER